jgi:hypothetical protein
MNSRVTQRLAGAGWREGRVWSQDAMAERLAQRGFTLFPAARAFLERYGGLVVSGPVTLRRGTFTYFHTDPDSVITDPSWTREWEQISGTRVFPIGETAWGDYTLLIDEHGRFFGMDMTTTLTYWADDAESLLDVVLGGGGTFRPVDADDRRPLAGRRP